MAPLQNAKIAGGFVQTFLSDPRSVEHLQTSATQSLRAFIFNYSTSNGIFLVSCVKYLKRVRNVNRKFLVLTQLLKTSDHPRPFVVQFTRPRDACLRQGLMSAGFATVPTGVDGDWARNYL